MERNVYHYHNNNYYDLAYMQTVLDTRNLSECLPIRVSNAWIVTKQKKLLLIFWYCMKDWSS